MYILQDVYFAGCIFCRIYICRMYIFLNHLSRSFQKATVQICLMTERGKNDKGRVWYSGWGVKMNNKKETSRKIATKKKKKKKKKKQYQLNFDSLK